jgi:ribosomal protein RSM22 (predicted rRNA methylase)
MQIPNDLRRAIEAETAGADWRAVAKAAADLSERYRAEEREGQLISTDDHRRAYLVTRVPATYAAAFAALDETAARLGDAEISSVLDVGAGPGTAAWAATDVFPEIARATLVERDTKLVAAGKRLAAAADERGALRDATWVTQDVSRTLPRFEAHDLVIVSYALGEVERAQTLVDACWEAARVALVVVEPGTRRGFEAVLAARGRLIGKGAAIAAPCPHREECPMAAAGDWCHFAQRVERTAEHRRLKGGQMPYEDEKYSYVAAVKVPAEPAAARPAQARIVRHPGTHPGHIRLELCEADGLLHKRVATKSDTEAFRAARKAKWGDAWEPASR